MPSQSYAFSVPGQQSNLVVMKQSAYKFYMDITQMQMNPFATYAQIYHFANYYAPIWYYVDMKKKKQGPFTSQEMDYWYLQMYFPSDQMLKTKFDKGFGPLWVLLQKLICFYQN